MPERNALVTGATGFIGQRLVPALVERGFTAVRACGRRPRPEGFPASVDYHSIDLAGDEDLWPLLNEVTHVFHLAGASSSLSTEDEMHRDNVVATERLVDAIGSSQSVERLLYMSSTSIYGEETPLPLPVEEEDEPNPTRPYGKAKLATEAVVWGAADNGLPVIIMRPVSVFGPGNVKLLASAVLDAAIERFAIEWDAERSVGRAEAGNEIFLVPSEPVEQRLVHINDVVRAAVHLSVHPWSTGQAYNVVFPSYPTSLEVAELIAAGLGMVVELSDDPNCGLRYEARSVVRDEMLARGMQPDILFTEERLRFMRKVNINNQLSIDALLSTGFQFADADLATGIKATVAWYLENKWIL
jgi:nucleoside-diphosphate-sugar epimerase